MYVQRNFTMFQNVEKDFQNAVVSSSTQEGARIVSDREHKYMTSEDFRGFGTIYHINHTAIRFCLTIRISIFNDVISLPILTDKNTFQTKANN